MSMVLDDQKVESGNEFLSKKRKDKQMSSLNHAQSKDTSNRLKKPKKPNDYQEEKKKKNTKKGSCEEEEGAIGYIHVRARRGQATDSHSLAERVRREKISERMKLLQSIVPGCDKVTGKALMLDEIINYVQSLQIQVEFLSTKLASVNPMLDDFGNDLDAFMLKPDENMSSMVLPIMPSAQQCSPNRGAAFAPATDNNHRLPQMIDVSASTNSLLFQQSQMPTNILSQNMSSMVLPIMPSVQQCSPNRGAAFAPATDNNHRLPQMIDVSASTNSLLFQQSQMPTNILSQNMSSMVLPIMPSVQQCSPNGVAATFTPATDNYHRLPRMIDFSASTNSLLFQQSQMPTTTLSQGNGQQLWDVDEQRLKLDNSFTLSNNMTYFH